MFKGTKHIVASAALIAVFFALALSGCATAASAEGGEASGGGWMQIVPLVLIVVVFYFLLIRPQNKKNKQTAQMRDAIKRGDYVTTIGGFRGRVVRVRDDDVITIEVGADKLKLDIMKWGISKIEESAPAKASRDEQDDAPETEEEQPKRKPRKLGSSKAVAEAEEKEDADGDAASEDDDDRETPEA